LRRNVFRIHGHLDHGPRVREGAKRIIQQHYFGVPYFGQKHREWYRPPVWIVPQEARAPSLRPERFMWGHPRELDQR
jgi:hypothetical protein